MSLINDALNKAQRERSQRREALLYRTPGYRPAHARTESRRPHRHLWLTVAATSVTLAVIGAGWLYSRSHPVAIEARDVSATPPVSTVAAPTADHTVATPQSVPAATAPSLPPPPVSPLAPAPATEYDLAGMSAIGSTTLLSVVRRSDKRSLWVPVGKTVGEITAVSYDATNDRAVIRVNGVTQTIALRDVGGPGASAAHIGE